MIDKAAMISILTIAINSPDLAGALCKGSTFWDLLPANHPHAEQARKIAMKGCSRCPALRDCRCWLSSLPVADRPVGIVAGRVIGAPTGWRKPPSGRPNGRPRKTVA
jgi:hypothetical protein